MTGVYNSLISNMYPEMGLGAKVTSDKVLDFWHDFKGKIGYLMDGLNSDSETIEWEGKVFQKNGAAFTVASEQWLNAQQFTFSQLLNALTYEQSIEKTLNQSI